MEAGISARNGSLEEQLENLLSLYLDSLKMVAVATDSLMFWEDHEGDENAEVHTEFWDNTKTSYSEYLEDAGARLASLFGIVLTNDSEHGRYDDLSGYGEKYGIDEIIGRSTEDTDWENFTLDDYQVDLIKARVTKEYWDKQFAIAEAVYNYSMDESSDRPDAEETKADYEAAFLNFKLAEQGYTDALASLEAASTGMNVAREDVTAAKSILDERQNTLALLRDEMETLRRIAEDEMGSVFQNEITNLYKQLRLDMGFNDAGPTPQQLKAAAYFASAKAYGIETAYDSLSLRVYNLIKGDEEASGILSLATLKDKYENAELWQFSDEEADNGAAALLNLGLEPTDLLYGQLLREYSWYGNIDLISADDASPSEKELMKLLSKKRIESLSGLVGAGFKDEYLARLSEISALTSRSLSDWLSEEGFDAEEFQGLTNNTMSEATLVELGESAYGRYLYEKSEKEKALTTAMSLYLDGFSDDWDPKGEGSLGEKLISLPPEAESGSDENIEHIAALLVLNAFVFGFFTKNSLKNTLSTWREGYDQVLAVFRNGAEWHLSTDEYLEPLRGLSASDPITSRILRGESLSMVMASEFLVTDDTKMFEAGDLFFSELTDIRGRKEAAERFTGVYFNTLSSSPALAMENRAASIDGLENILNSYAISTSRDPDGVLIPNINARTVWNNYEESGMSLDLYFARLSQDVIEAASILPEYYTREILEYTSLIGRYLAARGTEEGVLTDVSLPSDTTLMSIFNNLQELTALSAPVGVEGDPGITALSRLLESGALLSEMGDSFSFELSAWSEGTDSITLSSIDKQIVDHFSRIIVRRLGTSFAPDTGWVDVDAAGIDESIEYFINEYSFNLSDDGLKNSITDKVLILSRQNALLAGELSIEEMTANDKSYLRNLLSNGYAAIASLFITEPDETYISVLKDLWTTLEVDWGDAGITTGQSDAYLAGRVFTDEERVIAEDLLDSLHLKSADDAGLAVISLTNGAAGTTVWIDLLKKEADLNGSFYNRAVQGSLASMMDSDEDLELAAWILEINGIVSLSITEARAELFNSAESLEAALLSFAGEHEKELLWRKILESDPDAVFSGVTPEAAGRLTAYAGQLNAARRRLSAFDYDGKRYLLETAGMTDSEDFLSAENALSGMVTKDGALFAYRFADTPLSINSMNVGIENAYSQGLVDLIYKSAVRSLGMAGEDLNLLNTRKDFLAESQRAADRFENKLSSYRGYLGANYLNPDYVSSNSEDLAVNIADAALIPEVPDTTGLTVFNSTTANSGNFFENEYLEIVSLLNTAELRLETAGILASDIDLESGYAAAYFDLFENFETLDIEGLSLDDFEYQITKTDRDLALNSYNLEAGRLESMKSSIASAGYNYYISQNSAERLIKLSEMNDKRIEMEAAGVAYEDQLDIWKTTVDAMGDSQDIYSGRYNDMEDAETVYNQQLFNLEKSEAVFKYASSAYLGDSVSLSDAEKAAFPDTVDPEGKLSYALKQRAFAHARYNALADILKNDPDTEFTDFAERDIEYKTIYETYLKEAKNRIALRKLSDLVGGELTEQKKIVEASKEAMDKNIADGMYNEVKPAGLNEAGLNMTSFMNLSFGGSYPAYSFSKNPEPELVLYKNGEGIDVIRSISEDASGIDENGEATHIFLTDNARNKYFYFGGSVGTLIDSYGFTQSQAVAAQAAYNTASAGSSYYDDKIDWMDRMAVFTNGKNTSALFARWAQAVWYKRSLEAAGSDSSSTPEENFWSGENREHQYTSVMGTGSGTALNSHTDGDTTISQFKESAGNAYNSIIGEEKELFEFFRMSQAMDSLTQDQGETNFIKHQMRLVLGEKFRNNVDPSIAKKQKEFNRNMLLYAAAYATAIALFAGFFTSWLGVAVMVGALGFQALAIVISLEIRDLKKGADNVEKDIYGASGSKTTVKARVNSSVSTMNSTINTHAALHSIYKKNVSDMATLQGGMADGELLDQTKLRGSVLKALELQDTDLRAFLNLSDEDLIDEDGNPINESLYLTKLLNPYQDEVDIVSDEYKKDTGLYMQSYQSSSEHRYTKAAGDLNTRANELRLVQAEKSADYRSAGAALEAYYANSQAEIDSDNPVESTVTKGEAWTGKTEEELLADYSNSIDATYLNSSFVERTHLALLLETNFHMLAYIDGQASSGVSRDTFSDLEGQTLGEIRTNLQNLQDLRWSNYREAKESEWQQMQVNLQVKKQEWSDTLRAIMIRGNSEWRRAGRTMAAERSRWLGKVEKRYTDKTEEWDLKYVGFLLGKSEWVDEVAGNAAVAGSESINAAGSSAELAIRAATSEMVADLNINMPDLDAKVAELTGNSLFTELLENAGQSNAGASLVSTKTNGFLGNDNLSKSRSAVLALVDKNMREEKGKLEEELLIITAVQAKEQIEEAKMNFVTSVENANEGMSGSMTTMFYDAGWNLIGESYTKEIVVDSTVIDGVMTEERRIKEFKEYDYRGDVSLSAIDPLDPENLKGKGANFIEKTITAAMDAIKNAFKVVFGEEDAESEKITKNLKDRVAGEQLSGIKGFFDGAAKSVKNLFRKKSNKDDGTVETSVTETYYQRPGAFNKHVGLSAELKTVPNMNIISDSSKWKNNFKFAGTGEMGRIMGYYLRYKLEENRGWAELNKPAWETRIFDDDGLEGFTAPTIKDVTNLAVNVGVAIMTGGMSSVIGTMAAAGAGVLFNSVDDAAFGMMDIAGGYKSADQAWSEVGIKTAANLVTSGVTMGFNGIGDGTGFLSDGLTGYAAEGLTGAGKIAALTAMKGAEMFTTNMASGSISSISAGMQWDANGNYMGFDNEAYSNAFINSMVGEGAMAGYFSAMAGTLAQESMGLWNLRDGQTGLDFSGNIIDIDAVSDFNRLIGTGVKSGVEFGLTGETTLNVLNLQDILGLTGSSNRGSLGLLELKLGGDGALFKMGSGGSNMSASRMLAALPGLIETGYISSMKLGGEADRTALSALTLMGYSSNPENWNTGRDLLERKKELTLTDGTSLEGKKYAGMFDPNNPNNILLNKALLGNMDLEDFAKIAAIIGHESVHLEDNGDGEKTYEAAAYMASMNLYAELSGIFDEIGNDPAFMNYMANKLMEAESWDANEGSDDYFELPVKDGGQFQSTSGINWATALGFAKTTEEVDGINTATRESLWGNYFEEEFLKSGLEESERENFTPGISEADFKNQLKNDTDFADTYKYKPIQPDNLYLVACKMFTAMYVAEALTGEKLDPVEVNQKLKDAGIYADLNNLYTEEYMKAIELLTDNKFNIQLVSTGSEMTIDQINEIYASDLAYFTHIRYEDRHSELVSNFNLNSFAGTGYISNIDTINPWKYRDGQQEKTRDLARTNLLPNIITRWDIFRAVPVPEPMERYKHNYAF
ncbi:MAG: hypothetical protein L3J12_00020 [Spirochaetales bacterium]|nr:hypothetical protein [Spirochaetales bacterium]